jgi:fibronectin type 3 domain-containing protein
LHIAYNDKTYYQDNTAKKGKTYLYIVTSIDRLKNESDRTPTIAVKL